MDHVVEQKTAGKVVIVHGFFVKAPIMWPLQWRLEQAGFECLSISYSTYRRTLAAAVQRQLPRIQGFAADAPVHYLGYSLGGLFIRHLQQEWPEGFHGSRVVTLGTPHQGCSLVAYLAKKGWQEPILHHAYQEGLDGKPPPWPADIPLLSIAGSHKQGLGMLWRMLFGQKIKGDIHDGVVGYQETLLPEAHASLLVHESHISMVFAKHLIAPISRWFSIDSYVRKR